MAGGSDPLSQIFGNSTDTILAIGKTFKKAFKSISDFSVSKAFTKAGKSIDKAKKSTEDHVKILSSFGKVGKGLFTGAMDLVGIFVQLLDKMGVFQPIMDAIGLIFQLIGMHAMPFLMEALEGLYEQILSMDWSLIGEQIGEFLEWLVNIIVSILSNPTFMPMIQKFISALITFLEMFGSIIVGFIKFIGDMDLDTFKRMVIALAAFMAFMWGYGQGAAISPAVGIALGLAMAVLATAAVSGLMNSFAVGGIVTRPTIGQVGEAGPEAIIPLSQAGDVLGTDELLWATEENGYKIERLSMAIEEQNRLKRMKAL